MPPFRRHREKSDMKTAAGRNEKINERQQWKRHGTGESHKQNGATTIARRGREKEWLWSQRQAIKHFFHRQSTLHTNFRSQTIPLHRPDELYITASLQIMEETLQFRSEMAEIKQKVRDLSARAHYNPGTSAVSPQFTWKRNNSFGFFASACSRTGAT